MMLLTGATGFLGRELLRAASSSSQHFKGERIRCLVRSESEAALKEFDNLELIKGDITDRKTVRIALQGTTVVVHAAALLKAKHTQDYQLVNVEATRILVEEAKAAGVSHFIFISSILADSALTPYGKSKREAEQIVRSSGLPYTIFRVSLVYGDNDTRTIGKIIRFVRRSPVIPLLVRGSFQPVYVGDVVTVILRVAHHSPYPSASGMYYLAGPLLTFRECIQVIINQLLVMRLLVPVPVFLLKLAAAIMGRFTPAFNPAQIDLLVAGKTFDYEPASRAFGFSPCSFGEWAAKSLSGRKI